jgi:type IV pilus assembly protein PilY1
MYALDVTNPTRPKFLWKRTNTDPGFEELGQTWSRPRLTLLQGYANPVLVFGAGYDPAEDSEPPGTDTMGRGIYVVDAATGDLLWSAVNTCSGNIPPNTASGVTAVCLSVADMTYAIPSDIAFVDRSGPVAKPDGRIDKLYVGDVGGNVWRVDLSNTDMTKWTVTKMAAVGCDSGVCASGTAPRKFFFPPSVLSIKGAGISGSYDAISIVSGDREHPLKNAAAGSAYNTVDRFFMLKDTATTYTAPTTALNGVPYVMSSLFKITTAQPTYDNSGNGFYYTFAVGEKAVNAPLAVSGYIFFSTNKPKEPDGTCVPDLGTATAYAINPFSGAAVSNVLEGGGLPPSAVSGIVEYTTTTTNADNTTTTTTTQEKFCIGCGISGAKLGGSNTTQCSSALENCNVGKSVAKNLRRTYWYKK